MSWVSLCCNPSTSRSHRHPRYFAKVHWSHVLCSSNQVVRAHHDRSLHSTNKLACGAGGATHTLYPAALSGSDGFPFGMGNGSSATRRMQVSSDCTPHILLSIENLSRICQSRTLTLALASGPRHLLTPSPFQSSINLTIIFKPSASLGPLDALSPTLAMAVALPMLQPQSVFARWSAAASGADHLSETD